MRALLRTLCLLLAGISLHPGGALAADLVVAITQSSPPFAMRGEDGRLQGFNVDMAYALCERLQRRCVLRPLNFPEVIPAVARGDADLGIANTLKTPERAAQVAFTRPYWRSTSSFVARHTPARNLAEHMQAGPLCAIADTKQHAWLLRLPGGRLRASANNAALLEELQSGRCEMALLPTMQVLPFLQSPEGQAFHFVGPPFDEEGLGGEVRMVVRPDQPELLQQIDRALDTLITDGTHERLRRRYFPFSIL